MKLLVLRDPKEGYTPGFFYINDVFIVWTLEDFDRGLLQDMTEKEVKDRKVRGETCIPEGTYRIEMTYSPKFKEVRPEIMDVPGFDGIRIHAVGNVSDTEGCIGLGEPDPYDSRKYHNGISYSNRINKLISGAMNAGEYVEITIKKKS